MLVCCLLLAIPLARAQGGGDPNTIVFQETFDKTKGTGGNDNQFTGNIATNNIIYDSTSWPSVSSCGGANQCLKFGSSSNNGIATTPDITLTGTQLAVLTFSAAGWGDNAKNKLTVSVSSGQISGDTDITLENGNWNEYRCIITKTSSFSITFTGKRGFLDDVIVTNITSVEEPKLTESCTFWPATTEAASKLISITPSLGATVRYTTDGSTPTTSNGTEISLTTNFSVHETTTVKAIAYVDDVTSSVVTKTYTLGSPTVSGITAFKALAEGTEARLYMASTDNARVTFANSQEAYLRDDNGVLCLDFGTTAVFNPAPASQQHVAGWIVGQKQTVNGRPTLVATENTNTSFLALAPMRNESAVSPKAIDAADVNSNIGEWVSVAEMPVGTVTTTNDFDLTTAQPYDGAVVDMTGIVTATNNVAPTQTVTFVIDEAQAFVSPDTDLAGATVRLKRTLSKDYWNTFAVPFDIDGMTGSIREYDHAEGNTMVFSNATGIEAGKPYLVKPTADVVNPVYEGVTLTSTAAQTVTDGDYSFVAVYSPTALATDQTELFLTTGGKLGYPSAASEPLKGMRAYIKTPAGALAGVLIDDVTAVRTIDSAQGTTDKAIYNLNGQRVAQPSKGLYIVNGKKVIIQ